MSVIFLFVHLTRIFSLASADKNSQPFSVASVADFSPAAVNYLVYYVPLVSSSCIHF